MSNDISELKKEIVASRQQMNQMYTILLRLSEDVSHMKEANRSSSGSGSRFICPLQCGADFGKVCRYMRSCCKYLMRCR